MSVDPEKYAVANAIAELSLAQQSLMKAKGGWLVGIRKVKS